MKAILFSLIIGIIVGFGSFFAMGLDVLKRKKSGAKVDGTGRTARNRKDEDDDLESKVIGSGGKPKKIVPLTEWRGGRPGVG